MTTNCEPPDSLSSRAALLEAEIEKLQTELKKLGNCDAEKVVNQHIQFLHRYNEAKDATQVLIGKLSGFQQITVKELHEKYGLTSED